LACFDFVLDAVAWICCQFKGAAEVVVRPGEPGGGRRERGRDGCQRGCRYGARAGGGDDGWLGLLQQPLHGLAVGLVGAPPAASAPRAAPPPAPAAVAPSLRRPRPAAAAGEFGFAGCAALAAAAAGRGRPSSRLCPHRERHLRDPAPEICVVSLSRRLFAFRFGLNAKCVLCLGHLSFTVFLNDLFCVWVVLLETVLVHNERAMSNGFNNALARTIDIISRSNFEPVVITLLSGSYTPH